MPQDQRTARCLAESGILNMRYCVQQWAYRCPSVMAGIVPAFHGLRVEAVDASLHWHDGDHAPKRRS
jgi:hypothetical protein